MRLATIRRSMTVHPSARQGRWLRVIAGSTVLLLGACGSPALVADPVPDPVPTEPGPADPGPADPPPIERVPVGLWNVEATIERGSLAALTWSAVGADRIEVACVAEGTARALLSLPGDAIGVSVPIPPADCLTLRVTAPDHPSAAEVDVDLLDVVAHSGDAGARSLRAVLAAAPAGDVIGFAADVAEVVLAIVDASGGHDAHLVFGRDVVLSGRPEAPVVLRSDASLPPDPSGAPVSRSRIGYVPVDVAVHLDALVMTGGGSVAHGVGWRNDGDLTLTRSIVEGNRAWFWGGGVVNFGTARVEDSVLRGNEALVTDAERSAPHPCTGDPTRSCAPGDANFVPALGVGGAGGNGTSNAPDRWTELGVVVADNHAGGYGGGAINDHTGDADTLVVTGGTTFDGNTAAVAGDARFDALVAAP